MKLVYKLVEAIVRLVLDYLEVSLKDSEVVELMAHIRSKAKSLDEVKAIANGEVRAEAKKKEALTINEFVIATQANKAISEKSMLNKLEHYYKRNKPLTHEGKELTVKQVLHHINKGVKFKFNSKVYSLIKKEDKK